MPLFPGAIKLYSNIIFKCHFIPTPTKYTCGEPGSTLYVNSNTLYYTHLPHRKQVQVTPDPSQDVIT